MTISRDGLCAHEDTRLIPSWSTPHTGNLTNTIVPFVKTRVHQQSHLTTRHVFANCQIWMPILAIHKKAGPKKREVQVYSKGRFCFSPDPNPAQTPFPSHYRSRSYPLIRSPPPQNPTSRHGTNIRMLSRSFLSIVPFGLDRSCQGNLCR
jgi:hypothetical protein